MFTTRPELVGDFGMVSSTHWLASQAGMSVLENGGNAFDAAVAAGLVLQVVEPDMNGPAGEAPMIGLSSGSSEPFVVCGQGVSPASAEVGVFEDLGLDLIPGTGLLPACVPGAFGAWMLLLQRHGTLRLREVFAHAIGLAERGFPLSTTAHATIAATADSFVDQWPTSAELWLDQGEAPAAGKRVRNAQLAATYRRILEEAEGTSSDRDTQIEAARAVFYEGFVAEAIAEHSRNEFQDSSGRAHRGLLTYEDLAQWRAGVERPASYDYHGYTVCKADAWSQGPVFLQQLALLDGFDLGGLAPTSAEMIHLVTESAKLAFADREAHYGDPAHVEVPLDQLLSSSYADQRRALISDTADTGPLRPGAVGGTAPRLAAARRQEGAGDASVGEPLMRRIHGSDTCHLDVVDRHGNMVSATPSGGWLQSSPAIPGLGFCLGTRGQMFWLEHGLPNSLAPRKRPRTTLSPSFALRDGAPYLAFGTPGGDQQDQWSLLFFLRHVHHGMDLQQAIDAPNWHTTHFPTSFFPRDANPGRLHIEPSVGEDVLQELRRRGHDVQVEEPRSLGRVSAVSRVDGGFLRAGADARGCQGYATGR